MRVITVVLSIWYTVSVFTKTEIVWEKYDYTGISVFADTDLFRIFSEFGRVIY
ncbi:MAG: hypothetical protein IJ770_04025 [Alphaproteobacteria bacterium]|nr:hypothetical protein [Alphaproteobacteria bacterium]